MSIPDEVSLHYSSSGEWLWSGPSRLVICLQPVEFAFIRYPQYVSFENTVPTKA